MYSKVKSINKRHKVFLGETLSGEKPQYEFFLNIQMRFIRADTIVLYGTIPNTERERVEKTNPSVASSSFTSRYPPQGV